MILTNKPKSLQNTGVIETGVSDHHAFIFSFLKTNFTKISPNKLQYRNYKKLEAYIFLQDIGQLPEKKLYGVGKRCYEKAEQTRSSQNENGSRKS